MGRRESTAFDLAVVRAARAAVLAVEPAELPLLEDLLDPPRQLFRWRRPDTVGFGVEDAVHWATPYAVAAALWYAKVWIDEGKSLVEERTRDVVRELLQRRQQAAPPTPPSARTPLAAHDRAAHVRMVRDWAVQLGMEDVRADLLAHAVVGALLPDETESNARR
ncbi:hypothetical protein OG400_19115 [Micromonospora ureilytica]|uniref:hypothetical protein n=1 Tax=Micromonospora ureilytica TaxID=709868 RepID=UPI002E0F49A4|nr:hypothetical protein OG400_19115 [Micromonospora ureilytica]